MLTLQRSLKFRNFNAGTLTKSGTSSDPATPFSGDGCLLLSASTDLCDIAGAASNTIGTGPFTFEGWFRFTGTINQWFAGQTVANGFVLYTASSTSIRFHMLTVGDLFTATVTAMVAGTWYHVVAARGAGNVCRVWVSGTSGGSGTFSSNFATGNWRLGNTDVGIHNNGLRLSNVRLVLADVYGVGNTSITVPTSPLSVIASTGFLYQAPYSTTFVKS